MKISYENKDPSNIRIKGIKLLDMYLMKRLASFIKKMFTGCIFQVGTIIDSNTTYIAFNFSTINEFDCFGTPIIYIASNTKTK